MMMSRAPTTLAYVSPVRTRPDPLIRARRGPAPKLAPWIVGAIAERLIDKTERRRASAKHLGTRIGHGARLGACGWSRD